MEENKDVWQVDFTNFANGLGLECLVALGKIENPLTKKKELNPKQVRYIVDTLDMIKEKTKGNLTSEEEKFLEELVVYLKMLYVQSQDKDTKEESQKETEEKKTIVDSQGKDIKEEPHKEGKEKEVIADSQSEDIKEKPQEEVKEKKEDGSGTA
ncbi:MAG: DUF1844 domain-containing protein [Candidatus Saelkia tenebricola]|nr:DUF1844 domain-containing protein [Candidatus Saelkia tenebricola]